MSHPRAKVFFWLYLCAIIYLSLYPGEFTLRPKFNGLYWSPIVGRRQILDVILNVLFYVPLGAAGCWSFRRRAFGWPVAILAGGCLSWTIEWLQLWAPSRYGTLTDLTSNTLGAILGASGAYAADRWKWSPGHERTAWRWSLQSPAALLFGAWILWQTFPFVPAIQLARLTDLPNRMTPWSWITLVELFLGFAALRSALGRSPWLWVAFASLLAQAFLVDHTLSPAALCGAALGWGATHFAGPEAVRHLALILPAWLVFEELRPFTLADTPTPFAWAPFSTWYESGSLSYYTIIFGKGFLYLTTLWSLRARGTTWKWAIGIPAAILAIGEWAQQYLTGRTPESTDLLLLAAGAALLALCSPRHNEA